MEHIKYDELLCIIKSTKELFQAYQYNDKKLIPNISNLGGKVGDIAKLERNGEYYGISVELLEPVKPLLTDNFIKKILNLLKKEDYITPLTLIQVDSLDKLKYILHKWFSVATNGYNNSIIIKKEYPVYDSWIKTVTHDPLTTKIKLYETGCNKNTQQPVVPIEWIGREFDSGYHLHKEMDRLDTRIGKPPVTYAIIYSMIIQKQDGIITLDSSKYDTIFYLDLTEKGIVSELCTKPRKHYQYVKYNSVVIGFKLNDILEPKGTPKKTNNVGLLVSRLQKCLRRGRYASKALIETIDELNESPNYNSPEHNFSRVSASKQLVWRLFISILEDCRPYQAIDELHLIDLILITLITLKVHEYKFTKPVIDLIKLTALLAQYDTEAFPWRKLNPAKETPLTTSYFHNSISLALSHIIMMHGDRYMLQKYYSAKLFFAPFDDSEIKTKFHDPEVYNDLMLSSFDMHVKPHIILYYQACIPVSLTTKEISSYIWKVSSSYNIRYSQKQKPDPVLQSIQKYFYENSHIDKTWSDLKIEAYKEINPDAKAKRTSFLILFGKKYRYKGKDVVIAGTKKNPARVKIDNEWLYDSNVELLNAYPKNTIDLSSIDCLFGFKWKRTIVTTEIIDGQPIIDGKIIPFYDASCLLASITPKTTQRIGVRTYPGRGLALPLVACRSRAYQLIIEILSGIDVDFSTLLYFRNKSRKSLVNWIPKKRDYPNLNMTLIKLSYTKLFNNFDNTIMIGPVDRGGRKTQNSINYLFEGKIWAVFNLFSYLYPSTIKPHGQLNFQLRKDSGYIHLVTTLQTILFNETKISRTTTPRILTHLWDHQEESVSRILSGFAKGYHGFGDASQVGAGKTLTAIKIASELSKIKEDKHSGILVMLPKNKLITTWQDELTKHTEGFDIKYHINKSQVGKIRRNTIVITTMSKMRDHPINHNWLLLIIDECLSIQNNNALWTQEAWKQSLLSKHLIMMSATFFRNRFDKLYYMLKMLQSNIPEKREYLDTILLETMVAHVSSITRHWTSNINYFELDKSSSRTYEEINNTDASTEIKFAKLLSFLTTDAKVAKTTCKQLSQLLKKLSKQRCLIYARSNNEAAYWSSKLNIPIHPEKGNHCIITYHNGTYGLNDLIIYDTIIMRPPPPDTIPQIKGRLDRPGQQKDDLRIEYFVIKNTIEEGLILRMNIASQFVQRYIMPISKFYDISVNYEKYHMKN